MNDDELTERLRKARPQTPSRGVPLEPRYEAILERILSEPIPDVQVTRMRRASPWQLRPVWLTAASVLFVLVIAALGAVTFLRPTVATAATPEMLTVEPISGTAKEHLMSIGESVRGTDRMPGMIVRFQSWALAFEPEASTPPQSITPEEHEIRYLADGTIQVEIRAGASYDANGQPLPEPSSAPGSVLWSETREPGDSMMIFGVPPTDAGEVAAFFEQAGVLAEGTSGEYFSAIRLLLAEKSLTTDQEAALIEFLAALPDIRVDGAVTDRLGREGISFSTESRVPGECRDTLVVSRSEGILSYEVTYIGSGRTDIQAPAVIEYTAWE